MPLDGAPVVKRFTQGSDGLLDIWSEERGSLIASNMASSQSISDPLLDTGPAVPADLASYVGYMPMGPISPVGLNPYGYSYLYPSYSGFSPYPSLAMMAIPAYRPVTSMMLYVPRYGFHRDLHGSTDVSERPGDRVDSASGIRIAPGDNPASGWWNRTRGRPPVNKGAGQRPTPHRRVGLWSAVRQGRSDPGSLLCSTQPREVFHKRLFRVVTRIGFGDCPQLGVRTEHEVDTGTGPLEFTGCAVAPLIHTIG